MYDEEVAISTLPQKRKYMINRATTYGKYGIWGHDMENLILTTLYYDKKIKLLHAIVILKKLNIVYR